MVLQLRRIRRTKPVESGRFRQATDTGTSQLYVRMAAEAQD
jgi:hypothetical protein